MTYKFVTREEVIALWRPDVSAEAIKTLNRLLAERDAYREVASKHASKYGHQNKTKWDVDAEAAARLMEKK